MFLLFALLTVLFYLLFPFRSPGLLYATCASLGFFGGYWTLFITVAAELFGANLRATIELPGPNLVQISAANGVYNTKTEQLLMRDQVTFATAHGYRGKAGLPLA